MIEKATGRGSGTIYRRDQVFEGCVSHGLKGLVIKTHEADGYRYNRAILIVRNPFDAIESLFAWRRDTLGKVEDWDRHVETNIRLWRQHVTYWSQRTYPTTTVRYEDLKTEPHSELTRLVQFLGFTPALDQIEQAVAECSLKKMRASPEAAKCRQFFRRGEVGRGEESFNAGQSRMVRDELGPLLSEVWIRLSPIGFRAAY